MISECFFLGITLSQNFSGLSSWSLWAFPSTLPFFSLVCPTQTKERYKECPTNTKKRESWEGDGFIFIHNDRNVAEDWTLIKVTSGKEKHTALSSVWILFCVSVTKMWKNGCYSSCWGYRLSQSGRGGFPSRPHWRVYKFCSLVFFLVSS